MNTPENDKPTTRSGEVVWVMKRVIAENGREYLGSYLVAIAFLVTIALATAYLAWIMRDIVDTIFYQKRADLVFLIAASIMAAFVARGFATYGQAVLLARIGNNIVARYQARIFDHLLDLGMPFFHAERSGQLVARINQNVNGVRDLLNITLTSIGRDAVSLVALVGVMVLQEPLLSAVVLVIGPPLGYTVNYLMRRLRAVSREAVEINAHLIGAMQETVQGITIVKAFTMEDQLRQRLDTMITWAENRANKIARVSERTAPIAELLAGIAVSGAIAYAGIRTIEEGQLPGSIIAFITALMLAYDPARRLARVQVGLERSLVNARMIYEILDMEALQREDAGAVPLVVDKGEIRFERVRFSYGSELPVLDGVDLVAEAGKTTAIVGTSGAGKTTLVSLVQRFYEPSSGRILIDGQDISTVTKSSLRKAMAFVSQQPYLFEGSIRDNIRYGRADATDAEIEAAAKLAWAEEFIVTQPQGYDTPVGENGITLSGGQRQRLSIARAIVRNAPILLLDEATSALDNESESRVQAALNQVMTGRTTIVIAHRLSTVIKADRIVVMEAGRIAEQGTHAELMAIERGLYRRFYELQAPRVLELANDLNGSGGDATPKPDQARKGRRT